tara:strand:+ start:716 stop:991 length:276 start_codon:yes stop_codon:yes gene_type:complete
MNEKISHIIDISIDAINKDLNLKLNKSNDTEIIGGNSPLDSLGVLTFVMELEKNIEEILDLEISLVNDDFLSGDSPLKNIKELKYHLEKIL